MKKDRYAFLILSLHILIIVLHHLLGNLGHYGFDDLHYAQLAANFNQHILDFSDHYTYRFSIILLTAFSYFIFGISDFASSLPALFISVCILFLVFQTLKNRGNPTLFLGLSLTTLSNWFLFYTDKLMPDIYIALSVMLVLFFIHQYKFVQNIKRPFLYSLCMALALLLGLMAKGTIVLIIPLLFYLIMVDILKKRDLRFWLYFGVNGILILAFYFVFIRIMTGSYGARFEALHQNSYLNFCSYDQQPRAVLFRRIAIDFFEMMISQGMAIAYIFVLPILFRKKKHNPFHFNDTFSFFTTASIILLISSNFMTISWQAYIPMCVDPRHFIFLIPIVSISAAIMLQEFSTNKQFRITVLIILMATSVFCYLNHQDIFWKLYLPLTLTFAIFISLKKLKISRSLFYAVIIMTIAIYPMFMIRYAQKVNYQKQKEFVIKNIIDKENDILVITNGVQKRLGNYFNRFQKKNNIQFKSYKDFKNDSIIPGKKLLLLNGYTRYLSGYDFGNLPYYAKDVSSDNFLLAHDTTLGIYLYEFNSTNLLSTRNEIFSSLNDFEAEVPHWIVKSSSITSNRKFGGEKSYKTNEFSATFLYPVDSLNLNGQNHLIIAAKLYCNFEEETNSQLVISIEQSDTIIFWEGPKIRKYIKSYGNWWLVKYESRVTLSQVPLGSSLKVFLWNQEKQDSWIDDFEVRLYTH